MKPKTQVIVLVGLAMVWFFLTVVWPGRFPHTDDGYFKEPAYQLATSGRLVSPAYEGYFNLNPPLSEVFAAYQPVYVYVCALWFWLFPVSLISSAALDALIHLVLIAVLCRFFVLMIGDRFRARLCFFGVCILLLGHPGRPDELAMALAFGGASWLLREDRRDWLLPGLVAGLLFGLCVATSFPVTLLTAIWLGCVCLGKLFHRPSRGVFLLRSLYVVFSAIVVPLAILVPYYLRLGAWQQYSSITSSSFFSGLIRSAEIGSWGPYIGMLTSGLRSNIWHLPLYIAMLPISLVLAFYASRRDGSKITALMLLGALFTWVYILVAQPDQYLYFWFAFPVLLAISAASGRTPMVHVAVGLLVLVAANGSIRDGLKLATLPPGQRVLTMVDAVTSTVPQDARILVSDRLYFPLRSRYDRLRSAFAGDAGNIQWAEYCVFCTHRLTDDDGVWVPRTMQKRGVAQALKEDFVVVYSNLARTKPNVVGVPIGGQPVGYGVVIYKRRGVTL